MVVALYLGLCFSSMDWIGSSYNTESAGNNATRWELGNGLEWFLKLWYQFSSKVIIRVIVVVWLVLAVSLGQCIAC